MARGKKATKKTQATAKKEDTTTENGEIQEENGVAKLTKEVQKVVISDRNTTGYLTSLEKSRDIKIERFSLGLHGHELITDTNLEFNWGRRYGLLGLNGSGKSSLLKCLGEREVPIPKWISVYLLEREVEPTDMTALEAVVCDVENEVKRMEAEAEEILVTEGPESERLNTIYEILDEFDPETITPRAASILHGLGFSKQMQQKKTKDFSGGWRMRIALARALFIKPMMLLLDEPTNHLDLEACVWLEDYLKDYNRILVIISHSQDFLNGVCTNIIHLKSKQLQYYSGNYDTYVRARAEKEENQMKQFAWEQDQIKHMKDYIARFGHGSAKLAAQAKSKEKTLARMEEKGLTERVSRDSTLAFRFFDCGKIPPPVMQFHHVSFSYSGNEKDEIYHDLDFGIDLDTRLALVGPNGAGKSTLVKLMAGAVQPTQGMVRRHHKLRIGWFHQHLTEQLDEDLSPIKYMQKMFPEEKEEESIRRIIGRYGITGKDQTVPIRQLSDGLKRRVSFAWLAQQEPHLLLLDEPTNHLDMETIDALADAINAFEGGMVLVSHDFRLINQVAQEIWVCENKTATKWEGGIQDYKEHLRNKIHDEAYNP
eukprot:TRINITY_DN9551_c0_g1_i2.p1 TRINITY_DN9551_c0_g1~~TRINITY_DN9551_c0_g1_i2.p1  ORF type:complete len:597 (+),score=233.00 TRINITY_DN9551_c0_g1_i2:78-1868(+)